MALVLCYFVLGLLKVTRRSSIVDGVSPLTCILISCRCVCRRFRFVHSVVMRAQTLSFMLAVLGRAWEWATAAKLVNWTPTSIA